MWVGELMEINSGVGPVGPDLRRFMERYIVPLIVIEGDEMIGIGTGTVIGSSGVVLTARHVVEEAHSRGADRVNADGVIYRDYNLSALIRTGEDHPDGGDLEVGGLMPVVDIWSVGGLDVAFLRLQGVVNVHTGEPFTHHVTGLQLAAPTEGQRMVAFGYQGVRGSIKGNEVDYEDKLFSSDGIVTEVFRDKRDTVMLNFPSFHVEADFRPGMSGGPIFFDGHRGVSGIVCTGADAGYASGAMVWPGMGIPVKWDDLSFPDMLTFAQLDYIAVSSGLDRVQVIHDENGDRQILFDRSGGELS
jgi:hypothetical protein